MQIKCIQFAFLLCLAFISGTYHAAQANISAEKNERLQMLLQRARARKAQKNTQAIKEESGYLPAETSKTKEVLPEEKSYDELVDQFNAMFDETKTNIESHKKQAEPVEVKAAPKQEEVVKEKPKTITKTTAKKPVHESPVEKAPVIKEKPKTVTKSTAPKESTSQSPAVEVKTENKVIQSTDSTTSVKKTVILEVEEDSEEQELEEDEFEQEHHHDFENEEEEEAQLDEDEGLVEEEQLEPTKAEAKPKVLLTKAQRDKQYLQLVKKSLKSLEEDSWNEVKFNMNDALEYFEREKTYYNPSEVDKFYKITLGFLRFSEGGLELDQGDFADFEDAEAHYLDSQDIFDAVELKLDSKDATDKELLQIIQTVKKYINEDIEYIEEMIDLS